MSWIRLIPLEIDSVKEVDYIMPTTEIKENERILGQANDDIKKLFTLVENIRQDLAGIAAKQMLAGNSDDRDELRVKFQELRNRGEVLGKLMWVEINDSLDLWSYVNIGIRKDWHIVEIPTERIQMSIGEFLRKLLDD